MEPVSPILREDQPARFVSSIRLACGRAFRFSEIRANAVQAWSTTHRSRNTLEPHKTNQGNDCRA